MNRKRAHLRARRRSMREMDLILSAFMDAHGKKLSPQELHDFEKLLTYQDADLYTWLTQGPTPPPAAVAAMSVFQKLLKNLTPLPPP